MNIQPFRSTLTWIRERGYEGEFQPGDVLCVESCTGLEGGRECVKLEIQVMVTENGVERLDEFPFEDWL